MMNTNALRTNTNQATTQADSMADSKVGTQHQVVFTTPQQNGETFTSAAEKPESALPPPPQEDNEEMKAEQQPAPRRSIGSMSDRPRGVTTKRQRPLPKEEVLRIKHKVLSGASLNKREANRNTSVRARILHKASMRGGKKSVVVQRHGSYYRAYR